METDLEVGHVFFPLDSRWSPELEHELASHGVQLFGLKPSVFDSLTDTRSGQGAMAVVSAPSLLFDTRFDPSPNDPSPSILVLVDVSDPGNVGTLIRTAEAAGSAGVVVSGDTADVYSPKVVRASAGSVLRVPIAEVGVDVLIGSLRERSYRIVATAMDGSAYDVAEITSAPTAWLLGNEANGLRAGIVEAADQVVSIPMVEPVESLNVATAGAILLFDHASRNRRNARGAHNVTGPND